MFDVELFLQVGDNHFCRSPPGSERDRVGVRASGCAFEQHAENIAEYGEALADGSSMIDASGVVVASALYRCDGWILGEDADGVPIVIDTTTGEVESHGLVHKGTPTSDLPGTLALPLAIR